MENNRRKFGDTTGKQKQYDSDKESTSSGEEIEEEEEYEVEDDDNDSADEESLKKKIAQMRPPVKLRTFKKLLLHLSKDN